MLEGHWHPLATTKPFWGGGVLKRLARPAANPRTGLGAFDAPLDYKSAAGQIKAAAARKIAYAAIRGTARSALAALTRQNAGGAWL